MITVELVDDQALVRAGFHALLDAEDDIEVVAQAADGASAIAQAREHRPQVVLMDIRMPRSTACRPPRRSPPTRTWAARAWSC